MVILDGKYMGTSGTSGSATVRLSSPRSSPSGTQLTASTQIVASVIALLNDYQISKGRASLGFLNPWLYGDAAEGLNDITSGSNPGCGTVGFSAIDGWDPVLYALSDLFRPTLADSGPQQTGHGSRDARLSEAGENT